jgi:tetrahydromethanopterin S-methyltransferase subunit G
MALTDEDKVWLAGRLDAINRRLDAVDRRLDAISTRFDRLDDYILQFRTEALRRLDSIDQRVEFLASALPNTQPLTKAMLDLGSLMGQLTRAQQQSTDRHFDLETRIARLEDQVSKLIKPAA